MTHFKNTLFILAFSVISWVALGQNLIGPYSLLYKIDNEIVKQHVKGEIDKSELLKMAKSLEPKDTLRDRGQKPTVKQQGTYMLIWSENIKLQFSIFSVSDIKTSIITKKNKVTLVFYDILEEKEIKEGILYVEGVGEVLYDSKSRGFTFKTKKLLSGKFYLQTSTKFHYGTWNFGDDYESYWVRLGERISDWSETFIERWEDKDGYYFIALNKPKFRPGDTLKFKSTMLSFFNRPVKGDAELFLSYYDANNERKEYSLGIITPYRKGSYKGEFVVSDSLIGKNIEIILRNKYIHEYVSTRFAVEDYVLEKTSLRVKIIEGKNENYFSKKDKIALEIKTLDENDLPYFGGSISIHVKVYDPSGMKGGGVIYLPEISLDTTLKTSTTNSQIFELPKEIFPKADCRFVIDLSFTTPDGETHNWYESLRYIHNTDEKFFTKVKKDKLSVWCMDSIADLSPFEFVLKTRFDSDLEVETKIQLPFEERLDPRAKEFTLYKDGVEVGRSYVYERRFDDNWGIIHGKSYSKLFLKNRSSPKKIWVYSDNGKLLINKIYRYGDTIVIPNSYGMAQIYSEEDYYHYELLYLGESYRSKSKRISFDLEMPSKVFPGDSVAVKVSASKSGKKAKDLDVLAMSYKSSFRRDPVMFARPDFHRYFEPTNYKPGEFDEATMKSEDFTYMDVQWLKLLGGESPLLVELLEEGTQQTVRYLPLADSSMKPQFSVFLYGSTGRIDVKAFWIGRTLKYHKFYHGSEIYSVEHREGVYDVTVRTESARFKIKGVSLNKGFKTEVAIWMDSVSKILQHESMPPYFTEEEVNTIQQSTIWFNPWNIEMIGQGNRYLDCRKLKRKNSLQFGGIEYGEMWVVIDGKIYDFLFQPGYFYEFATNPFTITRTSVDIEYKNKGFNQYSQITFHSQNSDVLEVFSRIPPVKDYSYLKEENLINVRRLLPQYGFESFYNLDLSGTTRLLSVRNESTKKIAYVLVCIDGHLKCVPIKCFYEIPFPAGTYNLQFVSYDSTYLQFDSVVISPHFNTKVFLNDSQFLPLSHFSEQIEELWKLVKSPFGERHSVSEKYYLPNKGIEVMNIKGRVVESQTGYPIENARVEFYGPTSGGIFTYTNDSGVFQFQGIPYEIENVFVFADNKRMLHFSRSGSKLGLSKLQKFSLEELRLFDGTSEIIPDALSTRHFSLQMAHTSMPATQTPGLRQVQGGMPLTTRGARSSDLIQFIDGVKVRGNVNLPRDGMSYIEIGGLPAQHGDELYEVDLAFKTNVEDSLYVDSNQLGAQNNGKFPVNEGGLRTNFKDYAFFIPDLTTDKNGDVSFKVKLPDDVTQWKTEVMALSKGGFWGRSEIRTKAFSEVSAALSTTRYLVDGDTVSMIGRTLNFLQNNHEVTTTFTINTDTTFRQDRTLETYLTDELPVAATGNKMELAYTLQLKNGYLDEEKRTVDVLPQGLQRTDGFFVHAHGDTTFSLTADGPSKISLSLMGTHAEFLLEESRTLAAYPHDCNEQLASKLIGLLAQKEIDEQAGRDFKGEKAIRQIIGKLTQNRNDHQWGWWAGMAPDTWMTSYVTRALLSATAQGYPVEMRATLNRINREMPAMADGKRLIQLYALHRAEIDATYSYYLKKTDLKKLSVSEKITYAILAEEHKVNYNPKLIDTLIQRDILGNLFAGSDSRFALQTSMHNTLLLAKWLKLKNRTGDYRSVQNFVLTHRARNHWNTIDRAASIQIFKDELHELKKQPQVTVQWDDGPPAQIKTWPYSEVREASKVTVKKEGGQLLMADVGVQKFEETPEKKEDLFAITTRFENRGEVLEALKKGEAAQMKIEVEASEMAEYAMIEIPVPSGCTVEKPPHAFWQQHHMEVHRDRVVIYVRQLAKGKNHFTVTLQPRYNGSYTLNPAKVEMMYFPSLSGNNEVRRVKIGS